MITGGQLRAARAYANLTVTELASLAGVGRTTVLKAEAVDGPPKLTVSKLLQLEQALTKLGVSFGPRGEVNYIPVDKPET